MLATDHWVTSRSCCSLEFAFDSRLESNGAAGILYTALRGQPEWDPNILGASLSFPSGEPRLEVADLLAREAMKELDRKITNARPMRRKSRQVLDVTGKFHFIEHDRAYCERWREMVARPEAIAERDAYAQWLRETGRVQNGRLHDNVANRAMYLAWSDARQVVHEPLKRTAADEIGGVGDPTDD